MDTLVFNLNDLILLITSLFNLFFFVLLLSIKSKARFGNLFLALYFFQQSIIPLDILFTFSNVLSLMAIDVSKNIFHIFGFAFWLDGPLLLWYVRSNTRRGFKLAPKDFIYLLPFVAYVSYQLWFYLSPDIDGKVYFLVHSYDVSHLPNFIFYAGFFREVFRCFCGVMCFMELRRPERSQSSIGDKDLMWMNLLIAQFCTLRLLMIFGLFILLFPNNVTGFLSSKSVGLLSNYLSLMFILFCIIYFVSIKWDENFKQFIDQNDLDQIFFTKQVTQDQIDVILKYMQQEKPYLKTQLTIEDLARQLKLSPRSLSFILNKHFQCNFFEFISNYRINEAKYLLSAQENKEKSVLAILLESGFNSKASFNSLFKAKVGVTPREFRKQALSELDAI